MNTMSRWKDITKLSDGEAKAREAAFEAEMLTMLATDKPKPSSASLSQTTTAPPPLATLPDGIRVSVTENGQTTSYDLESVPASVRERIRNAWKQSLKPDAPPVLGDAPAAHPRSLRVAMTLNMFLPGAGQFYLGQRISGLAYAGAFSACLVAMLVLFVRAYAQYLSLATSGDILETGALERLSRTFPVETLVGLSLVGILIYAASAIHLAVGRGRNHPPSSDPRRAG